MAQSKLEYPKPITRTLIPSFPGAVTAFVQGGETAVGISIVRHLLSCSNVSRVWAGHIDSVQIEELHSLTAAHGDRLGVVIMDPRREASVHWAADTVGRSSERLRLLFNCVEPANDEPDEAQRQALPHLDLDFAIASLESRTLTPLLIAKHFASLFPDTGKAVFVNVSSRVHATPDGTRTPSAEALVAANEDAVIRFLSERLHGQNQELICAALTADSRASDGPGPSPNSAMASARALLATVDALCPNSGNVAQLRSRSLPGS